MEVVAGSIDASKTLVKKQLGLLDAVLLSGFGHSSGSSCKCKTIAGQEKCKDVSV